MAKDLPQPLAQATAETIGRRIVTGDWLPGSVLPNFDRLAEQFSVSRLSIREAIKMLAGKGLVQSRPRLGTVVRPRQEWSRLDPEVLVWQFADAPTAPLVRSLFEARRIIEPEAAALVAMRGSEADLARIEAAFNVMAASDVSSPESISADLAFHVAILTGTGNEFIAAFAPVISTSLRGTFDVQRVARPDQGQFIPRHGAIFEAILRGDPAGARSAFHTLLAEAESDAIRGLQIEGAVSLKRTRAGGRKHG